MSDEKKVNSVELNDDEMESVAGGVCLIVNQFCVDCNMNLGPCISAAGVKKVKRHTDLGHRIRVEYNS